MFRRTMSDVNVKLGLKSVKEKIEKACLNREPELQCLTPTLVAVAKTKPVEMIIETYEEGQRHFGENYVQELCEKGANPKILESCQDIKWHFIGRLQRNKVNKILRVPNLYMIETIDSEKLALAVDNSWSKIAPEGQKLNIMLQVNTSAEEEKNGMEPAEVVEVTKNILEKCAHLNFKGLMTIGKYGYDASLGPNPDFICLKRCRDDVSKALNIPWKNIQLSMGMSTDFEQAIELGSSYVRVGTSIFGFRAKKNE